MSSPPVPEHDCENYYSEKVDTFTASHVFEGDRYAEGLGDLQVLKLSDSEDLKLAKDGKTVLIPQPSDDPDGNVELLRTLEGPVSY